MYLKYGTSSSESSMTTAATISSTSSTCTYTYEGLTAGTKYYVRVRVIDAVGNYKTSSSLNRTLPTPSDVTLTAEPASSEGWTNGSVTVTATTDETDYYIEMSTDGTNYEETTSIEVTSNCTVYARLASSSYTGDSTNLTIDYIDTTKPTISGTTSDTDSITITSATDEDSGIVGYTATKSSSTPSSFTSCSATTSLTNVTISGLTQTTTYYVWVIDQAGNTAYKTVTTGTIPTLTSSTLTINYTPQGWTNGSVTVTASVDSSLTSYTLQYSTDGSTWTNYSSSGFTVSDNRTVYFHLVDSSSNTSSSYAGLTITTIDKTSPTVSTALSIDDDSVTTDGFTVSIGVTDTSSGLSNITWYYKTSSASTYSSVTSTYTTLNGTTAGTTSATTKTYTFSGLAESTTYAVYAVVQDVAGNTTTSGSDSVTTSADSLDETTSYGSTSAISYYADVDGDGEVDGIIFADIAVAKSDTWEGDTDGTYSYSYSWSATTSGLKEYELTGATYTDSHFGTGYVIAPVDGTSGTNRFYVMALSNVDSSYHCWWDDAYGSLSSSLTSTAFGKGQSNTESFLTYWSNKTYGSQNAGSYTDIWGLSAVGSNVGDSDSIWFVPSYYEWVAFGGAFDITDSNYSSTYGLRDRYWSSSVYGSGYAYRVHFYNGTTDYTYVTYSHCVRLATTF